MADERTEPGGTTPGDADRPFRCFGSGDELYEAYHDHEWGRPVLDEVGLLERLCLEGFQSGLSWLTILRKRPAFREAFSGFEPEALAGMGDDDVARLVADARIVRNRAKIEATLANGRATLALRASGSSLARVVWAHRAEDRPAPASFAEVPATTPASSALARELRGHGFRFVGPTTAYALMQACGVVNDHLAGCVVRDDVERERRAALGSVGDPGR